MTKTRVKDLSSELGVSNKDMLHTLRDLGISAKSHMSLLDEEDVEQVKTRIQDGGSKTEVIRKEIQPGVIVRRRRKVQEAEPETPELKAAEEPEVTKTPPVAKARKVSREAPPPAEAKDKEAGLEPEPTAETFAEPEPVAEAPASAAVEAKFGEETTEAAEQAEAFSQHPSLTEVESAEAEISETPGLEAPADDSAKPEEISSVEATEEEDKEVPSKKKKKRKKKKETVAGPQVRVISRPEPQLEPEVEPKRSVVRPDSPPARAAEGRRRPSFTEAQPQPLPTEETPGRKKGKKDRRVVEFPQQLTDEEERRKASLQAKKKKTGELKDKTGGKPRPGKRKREERPAPQEIAPPHVTQPLKAAKRKLRIEEAVRVQDMARQMGVKAQEIMKALLGLGVMATINSSLDLDTAALIAAEFDYEVEKVGFSEDQYIIPKQEDAPESLKNRPPVVTIMGHVDHGKTSLLDAIRETNVTSGEAGGITQHIGAYHVTTNRGEIVFLDTPGHEAFTAMRARGAQVTDLVVLVVAADDGVMDQTREAINHARAAGVPILVAVNKIDKEDANLERARRELADNGLVAEEWGGDTIFANVSAKKRIGIDELLEYILLQAEVMDIKANPDKHARGHIVEAKLDKGRGAVATMLIQEGTINQGDYFVCGLFNGRVRAMFNDQGKKVKSAGPSIPVEIQGFEGVPEAGDEFVVVDDEKVARRIADIRQQKHREKELAKESKVTLETFLAKRSTDTEAQVLNLVLKADVQGSLEAIADALKKLSTDEVRVSVIHQAAGAITESDILLASASDAIIIGFNVRPTVKAKEVAEQENVDIRFYDIIYKLVGEIKDAMSGMLAPTIRENYLGQAEVRNTFNVPKIGTVAGCGVTDGKITRNAGVRLLRDGVVVYTGKISSLKRFKDDVKEVAKGYECGIGLEKFNDIKIGDVIEAFEEVEESRTLE